MLNIRTNEPDSWDLNILFISGLSNSLAISTNPYSIKMFDKIINGNSDGKRLFMHREKEKLTLSIISDELNNISNITAISIIKYIIFLIIFFSPIKIYEKFIQNIDFLLTRL